MKYLACLMALGLCLGLGTPTFADHGTTPVVDSIDGWGAGTFPGALVATTDRADWYDFYAVAGTSVMLETVVPEGFDTVLTLYLAPGVPAAGDLRSSYTQVAVDDQGGVGNLSKITTTLLTTGNYVVAVEAFGSSATAGSYTLVISGNVSPSNVPEPTGMALFAIGSVGFFVLRRRRRNQKRTVTS